MPNPKFYGVQLEPKLVPKATLMPVMSEAAKAANGHFVGVFPKWMTDPFTGKRPADLHFTALMFSSVSSIIRADYFHDTRVVLHGMANDYNEIETVLFEAVYYVKPSGPLGFNHFSSQGIPDPILR